ncbi:hypothetical protein SDC9_10041 [bioreactor metagenome]|uniref:Peptidase M56 domain-containing protein n=5 Tax=root TaxID=1 RepID=Q24YL6_DESHY|nr:peptidase, M56 family [Desulfitobacterium hafniense DP7]BAE82876.1 hypothetical protein DSY1087 [Desulfitobacterium hafniense Y51]CDX01010.1 Peptidase, M56 [Desulfitobacterium hafniense]
MLGDIFYWVLNMSIIGSLTGVFVLAFRKIKKIPPLFKYALWLIPYTRLILPLGISSQYSLLTLISLFSRETFVLYQLTETPPLVMINSIKAADSFFPVIYKTDELQSVFFISSIIWISVFSILVFYSVLLYHFAKPNIKAATHLHSNVYLSTQYDIPFVSGIIKPKIIIPSNVKEQDISYILIHEYVHLYRKDNLLRCLAMIISCIHWFNPLSWVYLKYFLEDMELACDEKALKNMDIDERKKYAHALLNCASAKMGFASAFGGAKIHTRIENILSYRKLTMTSSIVLIVLFIAIFVALLSNAQV